ncbi:TPA: hypothetical protein EYN23_24295 [Candidatus Poribacteria bacterium]|nr:hypothetical protein [Candidatus Poribacteria bacterium]
MPSVDTGKRAGTTMPEGTIVKTMKLDGNGHDFTQYQCNSSAPLSVAIGDQKRLSLGKSRQSSRRVV